ncbi:imelysin family protein [uncultured Ferrimonas sp.]|uniref:imelysin family protein n=1 Tax=uncultured Ferrimonas sp. TaxID=432640 RepID=UPI00260767FA|nr:imelysin family protein [uncultured Ferrimonas sp.]
MNPWKTGLTAIAIALSVAACGSSSSDSSPAPTPAPTGFDFDASTMIDNLTDNVMVSGYQNLATALDNLHLAADNLRNVPTQANLDKAKLAWQAARQPWEQGESHIFGPIDALSIDPHLDSWPLNTTDLQAQLLNNNSFDADTIKTWNDDVQGFHTMEFLLFGDGVADNNKTIAELTESEREYLVALAETAADYGESLENAWISAYDGGAAYADNLKDANNNFYGSDLAVVEELINGMVGIVDEVGNGKIADPFGASIDAADTSLVESQYSWNSLLDFADNIRGVQNVYRGEFATATDRPGIIDFVRAGDEALASRIDNEIAAAIAAIEAIGGDSNMPFRQAITDNDGRVRIQAAVDALSTLQSSLETDAIALMGQWNG